MIALCSPSRSTGAIWSRAGPTSVAPTDTTGYLPAIVADWRTGFRRDPFYIVGLATVNTARDRPGDDVWAESASAAWVARATPHSGPRCGCRQGRGRRCPRARQTRVGERLALQALASRYGKKLQPFLRARSFRSAEPVTDASALRLHFDHVENGPSSSSEAAADGVLARAATTGIRSGPRRGWTAIRLSSPVRPFRTPFTSASPGRPTRAAIAYDADRLPACPSAPTDQSARDKTRNSGFDHGDHRDTLPEMINARRRSVFAKSSLTSAGSMARVLGSQDERPLLPLRRAPRPKPLGAHGHRSLDNDRIPIFHPRSHEKQPTYAVRSLAPCCRRCPRRSSRSPRFCDDLYRRFRPCGP